jgi:amidohydrolase
VAQQLVERVNTLVDADAAHLVEVFKDIHRNPELGFMETRTAAIVGKTLAEVGFEVTTGIGGTGVAAILRNGPGPTVIYRADVDALAVEEATGLDYASTVRVGRDGSESPVGHVCGHDAHVTWMLGMAMVLSQTTDAWSGTVVLIGQPAEELIAGAQAMVDDGLYDVVPKPDYFVGMHTAPVPVGMVTASGGSLMSGTDQIDIVFKGVGGHGSMPQLTKDPVLMAALAVVEFQAIVSRTIAPQETAVLTVGSVQAGSVNNVIPDRAVLKVNLRWFNPHVREQLIAGVRAVSDGIARTYGMPEDQLPVITMRGGSTPLVNHERLAARLASALGDVIGSGNVVTQLPAATASEDCHLLKGPYADVPLSYLLVGVADPKVCAEAFAAGKLFPYAPRPGLRRRSGCDPVRREDRQLRHAGAARHARVKTPENARAMAARCASTSRRTPTTATG